MKTWCISTVFFIVLSVWSVPALTDAALRVAVSTVPGLNANPYVTVGATTSTAWGVLFDTLTIFDPDGNLQPGLAESWYQKDKNTWTFHLRDGVTFHNGVPLTASSVAKNISFLLSKEGQRYAIANEIVGVAFAAITDRLTIDVVTHEPDAILPARLNLIRIVEPGAWSALGPEGFAAAPVGSGPFQIESLRAATGTMILAATPHTWRESKSVKRIAMRVLPDQISRLQALLSGQVDIAVGLGPDDVSALERGGFSIYTRRRPEVMSLTFRLERDDSSPIHDQRVRRAMNMAVDKQGIVSGILGGYSEVSAAGILSGTFGYDSGLSPYPYDPIRAQKLVSEAGFEEGFDLVVEVIVGQGPGDSAIYQKVAQDMAAIGIRLDIRAIPYPSWVTKYLSGKWGDVDVFSYVWTSSKFFDSSSALITASCLKPNPFYCNPSMTAEIKASGREMNPKIRHAMLQEILRDLYKQAPAVWLAGYRDLIGHAHRVSNLRARSMGLLYEDIMLAEY